jgi:hypothetical protein
MFTLARTYLGDATTLHAAFRKTPLATTLMKHETLARDFAEILPPPFPILTVVLSW